MLAGKLEQCVLEVPLPEDIGCDLHTIRLAYIDDFDISMARFRFSVIPMNGSMAA